MMGNQQQQPQQTSYGGQFGGMNPGSLGELMYGMGGMNPYGFGSQLGGGPPLSPDFFSQLFGGLQQPGQTSNMNTYGGAFPPNYGGYQQQQAPAPNFTTAMLQAAAPPAPSYTGPQPIGVDPALWAASGPGGLSTQEGGYSQDPSYWQNMNRIASGTQTFTPWTQAPLAAGVRGKPARSGFRGIPVPQENTAGYTVSNLSQPYGGSSPSLFGSIPAAAPTGQRPPPGYATAGRSMSPVNITPTIGNTGIIPPGGGLVGGGIGQSMSGGNPYGTGGVLDWLRGIPRF
jgi:hypothetical protein